MSPKIRILTGITTTGTPHLGNYVGAIRPALAAASKPDTQAFFFLADYHALIKCEDPERIARSRLEIAATWLAAGLDPQRCTFYRQSDIPEIPELTWLLTCVTAKGMMNRAHAYKAAVDQNLTTGEDADAGISMGLYSYPVLMAADILLFNANRVPVGRDQVQHIEMARDIAARFNHLFGNNRVYFDLPEAVVDEHVATLPGLDGRKMSKSYNNTISLFAGGEKKLRESIARIVTDSRVPGEAKDAEGSNLFAIYQAFATTAETEAFRVALHDGLGWGEAKQQLFEHVNSELAPLRKRYEALMARPDEIEQILHQGAAKARALASPLLAQLRAAVGLRTLQSPGSSKLGKQAKKVNKPARFVTFREKDRHFHFRFLAADGEELLLSVPFEKPQEAGDWVRVLSKAGGTSAFVWGKNSLQVVPTEHVGGHAYELLYSGECVAMGGPWSEAEERDIAARKLVHEIEMLWRKPDLDESVAVAGST